MPTTVRKGYIKVCELDGCGVSFQTYPSVNKRYCSREHGKVGNSEGLKKYWTDTEKRSQQAEMMKSVWSDPAQRQQRSASMMNTWADPNSTLNSSEYRNRISESMKLEWSREGSTHRTEEFRQKNRDSNLRYWELGGRELHTNYRSGGMYNETVWMRCLNSEGVFARCLDEAGIQWIYEPKRFKLSCTTYLPDFYLPEFDIWIEVKGWMNELSRFKIDVFRRETHKTLVVVMQTELISFQGGV